MLFFVAQIIEPSATPTTNQLSHLTQAPLEHLWIRFSITAALIILILIRLRNPELKLDTTFLALVVLAAVPWLAPLIVSIDVGDIKVEFQNVENEIQKDRQQTQENTNQLRDTTTQVNNLALHPAAVGPNGQIQTSSSPEANPQARPEADTKPSPSSSASDRISPQELLEQYDTLAKQYDALRSSTPRGLVRTSQMTNIANQMVQLVQEYNEQRNVASAWDPKAKTPDFLQSAVASDRLKGLYALPDAAFLNKLIKALEDEVDETWGKSQHFLEYREIITIGRTINAEHLAISQADRTRLTNVLNDRDIKEPYERSRYNALEAILDGRKNESGD